MAGFQPTAEQQAIIDAACAKRTSLMIQDRVAHVYCNDDKSH